MDLRTTLIQSGIASLAAYLGNLAGVVLGVFMYFPTLVEVPIAKMFLSLGFTSFISALFGALHGVGKRQRLAPQQAPHLPH